MSNRSHTTLNGFISNVKNAGMSKSSHYTVTINIPSVVQNNDQRLYNTIDDLKKYVFYCESTSLPGTSLESIDTTVFGESREIPTRRIYDTLSLSFYVDHELKIKKFFDSWFNSIINPTTRVHSYYDDYITTMDIVVYNVDETEKYKMTLYECYPKSIGSIEMSYSSTGLMKLQVSMQYKYYRIYDYVTNKQLEK